MTKQLASCRAACSCALVLSYAGLATTVYAQTPSEPAVAATELDRIVITATRSPRSTNDSPASTTVVNAGDMELRNTYRLGDALAEVPGLYMRGPVFGSNFPASGQAAISLRGIPRTPRTLVLVDGNPINNALSGGINLSSVMLNNVQRIEVVRGPYSALYGGNAMAGVIHVITRSPEKREFALDLTGQTGDVRTHGISAAYRDKFANGLALSLSVGYRDSDGWNDSDYAVKTASAGSAALVNGAQPTFTVDGRPAWWIGIKGERPWTQKNADLKLEHSVSRATLLTAGATYGRYETGYAPFSSFLRNANDQPIVSGTVSPVTGQRFTVAEADFLTPTPSSERDERAFVRIEHAASDTLDLRAQLGTQRHVFRFAQPLTATSLYESGAGEYNDQPNRRSDLDASLTWRATPKATLTAGIAAGTQHLDRKTWRVPYWRELGDGASLQFEGKGDLDNTALFAQGEWNALERFTLYAGVRHDRYRTVGDVIQNTAPAFATHYDSRSFSATSPKLAAVLALDKSLTLRASVGAAFRAPALLDLYSRTAVPGSTAGTIVVTEAAPNLKPERVRAAEIGADLALPTRTTISAALYAQRLTDLIYRARVSPTLNRTVNAGEARVDGIEVDARQRLGDTGLTLFASVTHLIKSEITKNDALPASIGKQLTDTPRDLWSLGIEGRYGKWSGALVARQTGHVFGSGDDTNLNTTQGVFGSYDRATIINAKLAYLLTPALKVSLAVENAANKQYFAFNKQPGTTYVAELSARF